MLDGLIPQTATDTEAAPTDPREVTEEFLARLAAADPGGACALLDADVLYVNVGLPPIRGRRAVQKALDLLQRPGAGFEVYVHSISADGPVVLTERTDVLTFGRLRIQFWVWGRFDVHDGEITLWRDSFDFVDITRGLVRGLVAMALPAFQTGPPVAGDAPGR